LPCCTVDVVECNDERLELSEAVNSGRKSSSVEPHQLRLDLEAVDDLNLPAVDDMQAVDNDAMPAADSARTLADVSDDWLMSARTTDSPRAGTQLCVAEVPASSDDLYSVLQAGTQLSASRRQLIVAAVPASSDAARTVQHRPAADAAADTSQVLCLY